jgi:hypothetical protein
MRKEFANRLKDCLGKLVERLKRNIIDYMDG